MPPAHFVCSPFQNLKQLLLPFTQEAVARAGEIRANLAMAQETLASKGWIVSVNEARGGLDLLRGRRGVFVIAGECDADAAGVDCPVACVPADCAILQQAFAGAVGTDEPVVGEKDHAPLAKVSR